MANCAPPERDFSVRIGVPPQVMYNPTKPYKKEILKLIESTWKSPHVDVRRGIYPVIRKKFSSLEVQHTDGIGTKGFYHWQKRTFKNAVQDAMAMNLNDLAMVGAVPYAIQNHIVLPEDDHKAILSLVKDLADECRKWKIAMTGGETSIHGDAGGLDISITVSGIIKSFRANKCKKGDVLIGFKSNGLHSNGVTKVKELFPKRYRKEFTEPTTIYLETILKIISRHQVNGMTHITGGAFTKLKDILGSLDAVIDVPKKLEPQKIFRDIFNKGVSSKEMYSTFNCGIGFIISAPKEEAERIIKNTPNTTLIGYLKGGNGSVFIKSSFDKEMIRF